MKKIQSLKKEKESLAMNYEQEEEYLTNDLSRKLMQVSWWEWLLLVDNRDDIYLSFNIV